MTTPYRTAPAMDAPRAPWWRRALCAIGSHSLYLVSKHHARCEHCDSEIDSNRLTMCAYDDAMGRALGRHHAGKSTPDEARFVESYYRTVRCDYYD